MAKKKAKRPDKHEVPGAKDRKAEKKNLPEDRPPASAENFEHVLRRLISTRNLPPT